MRVGYARVSTHEQSLGLQEDALHLAGCDAIFRDEGVSGATWSRPALDQLLKSVKPGDVIVIWRLDRLGRSLSHLIQLVSSLNERGIGFTSVCEAINTETASGRLLFHMMGALAEFERSLISERTRAGMAAAKARGASLGRPRRIGSQDADLARIALNDGRATMAEIASSMRVSRSTLSRSIKKS